ncbi:18.5 kDa class I heat shock protein-like [Gastrolobium bilobum]|uniref:18.5 kDa class I heat shock protein-like n=1 Tax=Gastrolobium bilobum TaxID=150636 RepID=UPI002AB198FA|nr:18.5 kDa class I heat shock protein-like [Gastrolobium bilobum]
MSIVPVNEGQGNGTNSSMDLWDPNVMALWDPFMDFPLPPSISNLFPDIGFGFGSSVNTRVDWRETARAHVWKVVLPGFSNEDVLVELQDERVLQVRVESGNFMSRFKIPENGDLQQLKANMHHGVLIVTVPKVGQPSGDRNLRVIEIDGTG